MFVKRNAPSVQQVNTCVEFHYNSQQQLPLGGLFKGLCENRRHQCYRIITWQKRLSRLFLCQSFFSVRSGCKFPPVSDVFPWKLGTLKQAAAHDTQPSA